MAGSAAITSNICTQLGHPSTVIQDININTFSHGEYYCNTEFVNNLEEVVRTVMHKYDHIIYHDMLECAVNLDNEHIPSSYMFHGNMLRQHPQLKDRVLDLESIDNIFVTTKDLLKYTPEAEMFYRPVDMNLFKPMELEHKRAAMLCLTQERYKDIIKGIARLEQKALFIKDRVKSVTPYDKMPRLLNSFTGYLDYKYQPTHPPTQIPELSQTGLQALACGIPVLAWDGWHSVLEKEYYDENSAQEFIRVLLE